MNTTNESTRNESTRFATDLAALEAVVSQLESGKLSLEDSLARFEQGIALVRRCQVALTTAEQKVSTLVTEQGKLTTTPFQPSE